ncbi:x-prolyl-dipeptidyl aminopeptidase [Streptococcus oralis subsp. oralis]|nr:x-prolyl-dipeptidyl aminopeptidase [Streptococcus oralis subsp. oralis]
MNLTIELPITKVFHLNSRIKHKLRIKSSSSKSILEAPR